MAKGPPRELGITTRPTGTWVQTDRASHERWATLAVAHPRAAALLHVIVAKMGRHNALVASQSTLAAFAGCSVSTLKRSLGVLRDGQWVEVRQIGPSGTVTAYVVNDRVAWSGNRDGRRYSLFSAAVLLSDAEQPDRDQLGAQPPLETIPALYPGEQQLPAGPGLPPPSEPALPGLEPDLPARQLEPTPLEIAIEAAPEADATGHPVGRAAFAKWQAEQGVVGCPAAREARHERVSNPQAPVGRLLGRTGHGPGGPDRPSGRQQVRLGSSRTST